MYSLTCHDHDPNGFESDDFCIVNISENFEALRERMKEIAEMTEKYLVENEIEYEREDEKDSICFLDPTGWSNNYETLQIIDLSSLEI